MFGCFQRSKPKARTSLLAPIPNPRASVLITTPIPKPKSSVPIAQKPISSPIPKPRISVPTAQKPISSPIPKPRISVPTAQKPIPTPIPKPTSSLEPLPSSIPKSSVQVAVVRGSRDRIPAAVRNGVWLRYHGERAVGQCYCCGVWITRYNKGWHCAHVKADVNGGEEIIDNLRTCCRHCNLSMGNQNLYAYIRDKNLTGPGATHTKSYLRKHQSQRLSRRTNNFGKI